MACSIKTMIDDVQVSATTGPQVIIDTSTGLPVNPSNLQPGGGLIAANAAVLLQLIQAIMYSATPTWGTGEGTTQVNVVTGATFTDGTLTITTQPLLLPNGMVGTFS